jgi:hypothetical protein
MLARASCNLPYRPTGSRATVMSGRTNRVLSKSKLCYDRRFSRPVCLGIKHPSGAYDQIFVTLRHLQACWSGALSLTRGRVCRLPDSVSSNTTLVSMYNLHVTSNLMYVYTTYIRPLCFLSLRAEYLVRHGPHRKRPVQQSIVASVFIAAGTCLRSRSLAIAFFSVSTIPTFSHHVTLRSKFVKGTQTHRQQGQKFRWHYQNRNRIRCSGDTAVYVYHFLLAGT